MIRSRLSTCGYGLTAVVCAVTVFWTTWYLPVEQSLGVTTLVVSLVMVLLIGAQDRSLRKPLIAAFLLRALLVLVHNYVYRLPGSGADAVYFEEWAWLWAQDGLAASLGYIQKGQHRLYIWLISVAYALIGRSPFMIQAMNAFLGTLVVSNVYRAAAALWDEKSAVRAAWLAALFPSLLLNSAIILREVPVVYFFTLGLLYVVKWLRAQRTSLLLYGLVALGLSAMLHRGMAVAVLLIYLFVIGRMFKALIRRGTAMSASHLWVFLTMVLLVFITMRTNLTRGIVAEYAETINLDENISLTRGTFQGRTAYPSYLRINTVADVALRGPVRILYFILSPFPWHIREPLDAAGFLDSLVYGYILVQALLMWPHTRHRAAVRLLVLVFVGTLVVFALSVSNTGTAIRHRAKLVVIPIIIAGGASFVRERRSVTGRSDNAWFATYIGSASPPDVRKTSAGSTAMQ